MLAIKMSLRECSRCDAFTPKQLRCRHRTCHGNYCWQHGKKLLGLRIKDSNVVQKGKGLFAAKEFKRNELIAPYTGENLTRAQIINRYPNADGHYVLCRGYTPNSKCVDGRKTNSSYARFANSVDRGFPSKKAASKAMNSYLTSQFTLRSSKNIKPGAEILTSYGSEYNWKHVDKT